jgi:mono/diheme cytochrome c family protein
MLHKRLNLFFLALGFALVLASCSPAEGDHAGDEFMPDMYHSIAYEANLYDYYFYNTWGSEEDYYKIAKPRKPVNGTIPRGYAGLSMASSPEDQMAAMKVLNGEDAINSISVPVNGSVPYYYEDSDEERERATAEIIDNPYPITDAGLEKAKDLYNIYCGICHGEKGNGVGYLVSEDNPNAKYIAQPANFLTDEFVAASNGRYYHAIMHGKNVMGAYADKLSYEERWQVIHYIRALQAKDRKLTYSEAENTLNNIEVPASQLPPIAMAEEDMDEDMHDEAHQDGEHHSDEAHDDHGDHGEDHH